jgi:hypothetical protein
VDAMKKVSSAGVPYASEASAQMTALKPLMQQRRPRMPSPPAAQAHKPVVASMFHTV